LQPATTASNDHGVIPVVLAVAVIAAPARVIVLPLTGDLDAPAASALSARLAAVPDLEVTVASPGARDDECARATWRGPLDEARGAVTRLDPPAALEATAVAAERARACLDHPPAVSGLAEAARLRGRILLFTGNVAEASQSFRTAAFLEPGFVPAVEAWPPEARLAYADARGSRAAGAGVLSIEVEPREAELWLDGRYLGQGPTTVSGVEPGDHQLLATCVGASRRAAAVSVAGQGRLEKATLFLEALPPGKAPSSAAAALTAADGSVRLAVVARQAAQRLGADALVLLTGGVGAGGRARCLDRRGETCFDEAGAEPEVVAAGLSRWTAGRELMTAPVVAPPTPWYSRWPVWAGAGAAAAVIGGTVAIVRARSRTERRVDLYLGQTP
jgi:hypothetical protein